MIPNNDVQVMCEKSIIKFGEDAELRKSMEECAELIQGINKWIDDPSDETRDNVIEEIVDVAIISVTLKTILGITDSEFEEMSKRKLEKFNSILQR